MKPSWVEVTVLGLLLLFSILMANGWPSRDWALWWAAIGALATTVTGFAAVMIALGQQQKNKEKEDKQSTFNQILLKEDFTKLVNILSVIAINMAFYIRDHDEISSEDYDFLFKGTFKGLSDLSGLSSDIRVHVDSLDSDMLLKAHEINEKAKKLSSKSIVMLENRYFHSGSLRWVIKEMIEIGTLIDSFLDSNQDLREMIEDLEEVRVRLKLGYPRKAWIV